jgi:predicted nuclease with TOPRIM domain
MSFDDRPEFKALNELEQVLANLREGISDWRRRALRAESERAEIEVGTDAVALRERLIALEAENADLNGRLDAAKGRLEDLLSRLRFLEEQVALEEQRS